MNAPDAKITRLKKLNVTQKYLNTSIKSIRLQQTIFTIFSKLKILEFKMDVQSVAMMKLTSNIGLTITPN
jgi:hypothetical protein